MIPETLMRVKSFAAEYRRDIFIALCILLVTLIAFGLGRLSAVWENKTPIRIEATH